MKKLRAEIEIPIRFSEVDSMGIVWHGNYAQYFEEAREAFGRKYNLGYLIMFTEGFYAPLVEMNFGYKRPLTYGDTIRIEIEYINNEAAKLEFEYKIFSTKDNSLVTTGKSTQVFLTKEYELLWSNPPFYQQWKERNL
ncbi:MAG: acyl-CoA thioesterase [Bacteroidales bacterium]